jgi:pyruvate formate lyase activating enzyme
MLSAGDEMLPIKGLQKTSMIDYPGKMCSVVFVADCNFRCPYCQNPDLILRQKEMPDVPHEEIFSYLRSRKKWIDGVCITGGEPCIHGGLPDFARKLGAMGLLVKLDTNGSRPEMLKHLIKKKLLDYIAMDIKSPIEKYGNVAGVRVKKSDIKKSTDMIMKSGIDYEFRTTAVPRLIKEDDVVSIGKWLNGARLYCIQQFRPVSTLDREYEKEKPYPEEGLKGLAKAAAPYFRRVEVRS